MPSLVKMDVLLQPHPSIVDGLAFTVSEYSNYMIVPSVDVGALYRPLYLKPGYVNLVIPINAVTLQGNAMIVTQYYEGLMQLHPSHFRRFFEAMTTVVEYLHQHQIYHDALWNRHSIWTHNGRYFVRPFTPAVSGSPQRALKDAFILAANLMFSLDDGTTFTTLRERLARDHQAAALIPLYNAVMTFDGDFSTVYHELLKFKPALRANFNQTVTLSTNPAEKQLQLCVLRASRLIDD